jgi:hypothetical protein
MWRNDVQGINEPSCRRQVTIPGGWRDRKPHRSSIVIHCHEFDRMVAFCSTQPVMLQHQHDQCLVALGATDCQEVGSRGTDEPASESHCSPAPPRRRIYVLRHPAHIKLVVALMLTSVTLSASSAFAQSQATRPDSRQKDVAPAQGFRLSDSEVTASEPKPGGPVNEVTAEEPPPNYLKSEVDTLKAENAVVRELLRKMEERQKALLEQVDRLQRRLDGATTAVVQASGPSQVADAGEQLANGANASVPATSAGNASAQQASVEKQDKEDHYQDGIIIWQTPKTLRSLSC